VVVDWNILVPSVEEMKKKKVYREKEKKQGRRTFD